MARFCPQCGTTVQDDQTFCPNCGTRVEALEASADSGCHQPFTPPVSNNGQSLSIASLVLGVLGVIGVFIPLVWYLAAICAILGIILGAKGRQMSITFTGSASGLATAGLVLGIIGSAFAAPILICTVCSVSVMSSLG